MPVTARIKGELRRFPHMFPLDLAIWKRFLKKFDDNYRSFKYDIKVGEGRPPLKHWDKGTKKMQEILTKKRIDAVGFGPSFVDVIEVKPAASSSALGQIITYTALFKNTFETDLPIRPVIVTDSEEPDMRRLTDELGIILVVV